MAVEEFKNGTLIAKVETSQFVLLTDEENLDLKVSMLRELKDEDSEVQPTLGITRPSTERLP